MTKELVRRSKTYWLTDPTGYRKTFDPLRDLKIERWCLKRLKKPKRALRKHSQKQISIIEASIKRFDWLLPIIVSKAGEIVCGLGRYLAALNMGLTEVPVICIEHLSETDLRLFRLAETRIAELSDWDNELLKLEVGELSAADLQLDLDVTGFDTADVDRILSFRVVEEVDDAIPSLPDNSVSRLGDHWILGDHAVLCGDALDRLTYLRLLGNQQAQMVITDPPYNVKIRGHARAKNGQSREFVMASGEMSSVEFKEFLSTFLSLAASHSCDGSIHYVFMDAAHMIELLAAAVPIYGKPKNLCVWVKDNAGMGSFYRSRHELVFVFKNGDGRHINNFGLGEKGRFRSNVWNYPGANSGPNRAENLAMHPTVKPTALVVDAIKDCSHRHGLILDPFGGSGTTVIACERTGRRARIAELDPVYVDVIVERWQHLTRQSAVHAETGKTFEETARERGQNR